jgi:hypothetical protein
MYETHGALERAVDTYEGLMTALAATDTGWSRSRRTQIDILETKIKSLRSTIAEDLQTTKPARSPQGSPSGQ